MQVKCYIIDDELFAIDILQQFISDTPGLNNIGYATNALEALEIIKDQRPDLTFLDVDMPLISGIDVAKLIQDYTTIIFTTAHSKYAVAAFDNNAIYFLLKPISYARFLTALEKFKKSNAVMQNIAFDTSAAFYIKTGVRGKIIRIEFSEIEYVEGSLNYITIYLDKERHLTYLTMKEVESFLPKNFLRIHKSFIINIAKIKIIENGNVVLKNKSVIPIGNSYKKNFLDLLESSLFKSGRE